MTLAQLKEQKAAKVAEMRALNDNAKETALSADDQKKWDDLDKEVRSIDDQIGRQERLQEIDRHAPAVETAGDMDLRNYSVAKALSESMSGNLTGLEAETHQELSRGREVRGVMIPSAQLLERRALTTTAPASGPGGNLVATNLAPVQDRFRSMLMVERLGATVMRNLTGNMDLPNLSESGSAHWISEHSDTTRSDAKFVKRGMTPRTVSGEYEVSRRMLLQASSSIDTILRNDLGYILAQALDAAAIRGGGSDEPTGIIADGDVQSVGASPATTGAELSDLASDMIAALEVDDVNSTAAFLSNPAVANLARKRKDTDGRPISISSTFHEQSFNVTTQVPADIGSGSDQNALIFGHWASLVIGYWSGVDILVNPYHTDVASKGGALIHAFLDADVVVRQPNAFRYGEVTG